MAQESGKLGWENRGQCLSAVKCSDNHPDDGRTYSEHTVVIEIFENRGGLFLMDVSIWLQVSPVPHWTEVINSFPHLPSRGMYRPSGGNHKDPSLRLLTHGVTYTVKYYEAGDEAEKQD